MKLKFFSAAILLVLLFCTRYVIAQSSINSIKRLDIGDTMPDIPLGTIINNYTGKTKFSEFKGKLVILDFWSTGCTYCISLFPYMEKLQKQFSDQVQIFLVNPWETQKQIEERLKVPYLKRHQFQLPNLPSIVGENELSELFPVTTAVPHHVWIDKEGIIKVRGSHLNTNAEKIIDLLEGKEIIAMNDNNSSLRFNKDKSYFAPTIKSSIPLQLYNSGFTSFNNNYAAYNGGSIDKVVDSLTNTVRTTFINSEVLKLYEFAFEDFFNQCMAKTIYSPNRSLNMGRLDYFGLAVKDTLQYTSVFAGRNKSGHLTDKDYIKSRFCYELTTSLNVSKERRGEYIAQDINRYFGDMYGTTAKIEKRKIPCYVLVRRSKDSNQYVVNTDENKRITSNETIRYNTRDLSATIWEAIAESNLFKSLMATSHPLFILNEVSSEDKVNILLPPPGKINTLADLSKALKPYNLDIVQTERNVDFLVIKDN